MTDTRTKEQVLDALLAELDPPTPPAPCAGFVWFRWVRPTRAHYWTFLGVSCAPSGDVCWLECKRCGLQRPSH